MMLRAAGCGRRCGVRSRVFAWKKSRDLLSLAVAVVERGTKTGKTSAAGKTSAPREVKACQWLEANALAWREQRRAGGWAPARTSGAPPPDLRRGAGLHAAR